MRPAPSARLPGSRGARRFIAWANASFQASRMCRRYVGRRLDRRDFLDLGRAAPGQDVGLAVDAGMTEPALGTADQAAGHLCPLEAGKLADDRFGRFVPRQAARRPGEARARRAGKGTTAASPAARFRPARRAGAPRNCGCRPTAAPGRACRHTRPRSWSCPDRCRRDSATESCCRTRHGECHPPSTSLAAASATH